MAIRCRDLERIGERAVERAATSGSTRGGRTARRLRAAAAGKSPAESWSIGGVDPAEVDRRLDVAVLEVEEARRRADEAGAEVLADEEDGAGGAVDRPARAAFSCTRRPNSLKHRTSIADPPGRTHPGFSVPLTTMMASRAHGSGAAWAPTACSRNENAGGRPCSTIGNVWPPCRTSVSTVSSAVWASARNASFICRSTAWSA